MGVVKMLIPWNGTVPTNADPLLTRVKEIPFLFSNSTARHWYRKRVKLAFSIRSLLAIVLAVAVGLGIIVAPRLERQRIVERLEKEPVVSNVLELGITEEPTLIDRILGLEGRVDSLLFESRGDERQALKKQVFESVRLLSPLTELNVENVNVEPCAVYPFADKLVIRNVDGDKVAEWLRGLLRAQTQLKKIEVEWTPKFSDEHLEILCSIGSLESISLAGVSATGVGFQKLSKREQGIELSMVECPITDEGLSTVIGSVNLNTLYLDISPKFQCPDLRLLLRASKLLDLSVELGCRPGTSELKRTIKELDDYFGCSTVHFEDSDKYYEELNNQPSVD